VVKQYATALAVLFVLSGCGGSKEIVDTTSAEARFDKAKAMFDNGNYLEAINEFQAITLQFPGATLADDAQYYLAECHFKRGEYILAAYEYAELKRSYAASPLVPDAQFKLGMCYYEMSPNAKLDQQYTLKARDELQAFVEYYPSNDSAVSAAHYIEELTERLAKKKYDTAQLYSAMEYYRAAVIYYDDVIENYHDTKWAPPSYIGKIKALIARNKYGEASLEVTKFISSFPNSVFRGQAEDLKKKIDDALEEAPNAASSQGSVPPESHQQLQ
jgi:outer membrane protein assembly factor BamD